MRRRVSQILVEAKFKLLIGLAFIFLPFLITILTKNILSSYLILFLLLLLIAVEYYLSFFRMVIEKVINFIMIKTLGWSPFLHKLESNFSTSLIKRLSEQQEINSHEIFLSNIKLKIAINEFLKLNESDYENVLFKEFAKESALNELMDTEKIINAVKINKMGVLIFESHILFFYESDETKDTGTKGDIKIILKEINSQQSKLSIKEASKFNGEELVRITTANMGFAKKGQTE